MTLRLTLIAALACLVCVPDAASAAERPLAIGFAESRYLSSDEATRDVWFDRSQQAGAGWARISVSWRASAPLAPLVPANPASAAYNFRALDAAVREATERGQAVLLTISHAPAWAEGAGRPALTAAPSGTWKPNPTALGAFAAAIATRYSGFYPDPASPGKILPRVSRFEVWNEPNLAQFLSPQRAGGQSFAAAHYRRMLNAVYTAVHAIQPTAIVAGGALSPIGTDKVGGQHGLQRTGPLAFLRELLCLSGKLTARPCGQKTLLDALSHHPIGVNAPPRKRARGDDAGIAEMGTIVAMLRAAELAGSVPGGPHPVWASEIWWHSKPPATGPLTPSLVEQARYISEGLYLLWKQGVSVAILYQLGDQPAGPFQTGVYFASGQPKPALSAVRFPLVGERKSRGQILAWGRAPAAGTVQLELKTKGKAWRTVKRIPAVAGGVFTATVKLKGKGQLRASLGAEHSLVWAQR